LLDRLLIITTRPYTKDEIKEILKIRAKEEKIEIEEDVLDYLADLGEKTSLRYVIQLLAPANVIASERKSKKIEIKDIERAKQLFLDTKRAAEGVEKYQMLK
jgi:TBP-interacting protein